MFIVQSVDLFYVSPHSCVNRRHLFIPYHCQYLDTGLIILNLQRTRKYEISVHFYAVRFKFVTCIQTALRLYYEVKWI